VKPLELVEAHVQAVSARDAEIVQVGGFTVFLGEDRPAFAAPRVGEVAALEDLSATVAELRALFSARGLPVRVEYTALLHPALSTQLERAGLVLDEGSALFVCQKARFQPPPARVEIQCSWASDRDEDLAFVASMMRQGFDIHEGPVTAEDVAALRGGAQAGLRYAVAKVTGLPAATGTLWPVGPTAELSSVSTMPTMRRRGAARALMSFMVSAHFAAGGELVWASPGSGVEADVIDLLLGLGFEDGGMRLSYVG
jgi:hypothetical protein